MTEATKTKLIAAALRLFAERGFRATTVGDIEEAAGLTRRGRAFYRHFASKEEILGAALRQRLDRVASNAAVGDLLPLGDVRAEITLTVRWILKDVRADRDLVQLLEREGDKVDAIREEARRNLMDAAHAKLAELIKRWAKQLSTDIPDADALASVLFGAAVNFVRLEWTYGRAPLEVTDERFVEAWTTTAFAAINAPAVVR